MFLKFSFFFPSSREGVHLKKRGAFDPTNSYAFLNYSSLRSFVAQCILVTTGTAGRESYQKEY